ncbi:hypothetical protein C4559_02560 [Candidatus Microgenomates bacterium]|nr:MAG: hypothetical protein C4559_02560 [Candidatus Microgenomates bacterium]
MKIFKWLYNNIFFVATLFLLFFVPLYPKLPVININHTWVYIRAEDFVVALVFSLWLVLMISKRITFKTPLTMPIIIFWIIGVISTIHGVLLIFPTLGNVFPNVAFLNYIRRIEYISLFFVAFTGLKDKKFIPYIVWTLTFTLLLVSIYGIGQKYLGFPAFLTMNEEFAKGIPIRLSQLSRVSSTFGGHYDLAAYLVLIIPILSSMIFGFKNLFAKLILLASVSLGFIVLFMTVSRVSFFVLLLSLIIVLILHKKKFAILAIIALFLSVLVFLSFSTSLLQRFGDTFKEVDILVDAKNGEAIGQIKEIPSSGYKNKTIMVRFAQSRSEIEATLKNKNVEVESTNSATLIIPFAKLPPIVTTIFEPNSPTGENLPQGTGYINLTMTPIVKKIGQFFYQRPEPQNSQNVLAIQGNFLIKRVVAYDLSFTTRFQGEWPHAIAVFEKNIFFGGGYSSTGLAVDNNYLRILGEVGVLGFISYFAIFFVAGIYIKKILPEVDSPVIKSFIFGFAAGGFGLALNAVLIDVFEASKIAFVLWLLIGVAVGVTYLYQKKEINIYGEFKKVLTSPYTIIIGLFITTVVLLSPILNYYFVGDDFIWFKWVVDCGNGGVCPSITTRIFDYFTNADGFFYRPGTKMFFLLMYKGFWLNQTAYHIVSIALHFLVSGLVFLISKKFFNNFSLAAGTAFLFLILSGYSETVFWVSSTGSLFNAFFILLGLLFYSFWLEKKKNIYFIFSLISVALSLLFHELGVVAPLILILYRYMQEEFNIRRFFKKISNFVLFIPLILYLILRFFAQSHWFSGDYSYNLLKLPFNFVGNAFGYLMLDLFGPATLPFYEKLRNFSRENTTIVLLISIAIVFALIMLYKIVIKKIAKEDKRILTFGCLFFLISLLPFLGLGNIAPRYSYLSSIGIMIIFVFFAKKIYSYISYNGRSISISSMVVIIGIFTLIHIMQLQKIHNDWEEAGNKVVKFFISLDYVYSDSWKKDKMNFYFVNVPIRTGDAWVFPVGLDDAVWFVFQNKNIDIYKSSSLEEAFNTSQYAEDKIFVFEDNGSVTEKKKPLKTAIIPVKK